MQLCRQNSGYEEGPLLPKAAIAFKILQQTLAIRPIQIFPQASHYYVLVTEAHQPLAEQKGGVSAILCKLYN